MLSFGASKPGVKGRSGPLGPRAPTDPLLTAENKMAIEQYLDMLQE